MANYRFVARFDYVGDDERQIGLSFEADPSADEGDVETAFDTLWAGLRQYYDPFTVLTGFNWYEGVQIVSGHRVWGDSFRVTDRNVAGNGAGKNLPPQVAVVISFPMPISAKRHRGRVYMPAPHDGSLTDSGRFQHYVEFAAAWETFLEACMAAGWTPVVVSVSTGSLALLPIESLRVDNSFDTQRRRKIDAENAETRVVAVA